MATPTYCTRDEVVDVLTRDAADTSGNAGSDDPDAVDKAIVDAQNEIDAKLALKYTVPFSPVPGLINAITQDIAAYLSDLVFRENRDYQTNLSPIYLRYQRAEDLLGKLSTGEAIIPPDGSNPENPPDTGSGLRVAAAVTRLGLVEPSDFDFRQPMHNPWYWTPEGWAIHP